MAIIKIPAVLSQKGSSQEVEVEGDTVLEAFKSYTDKYSSELEEEILEDGKIKEYINVYVNGKDVRNIDGINTRVGEKDEIRVMPAASGGCILV